MLIVCLNDVTPLKMSSCWLSANLGLGHTQKNTNEKCIYVECIRNMTTVSLSV